MFSKIRLAVAILFFLTALLIFFKAPTNFFWKLSIVSTEFGIVFVILCLLPLISRWWNAKTGLLSAGLLFISLIIYLSPIYKATLVAKELPGRIKKEFGEMPHSPGTNLYKKEPFSYKTLLLSFPIKDNQEKKFITKVYHHFKSESLTLDFYESRLTNSPCVIVIHGGAWNGGDSRELPQLNSYLANRGYAVASINYRLSPKNNFPAQLEDIKSAIEFLKNNAFEFKINPSNFVLLGRSAGGQLALMAAYTIKDAGIKGVISFYAPADMVWATFVPGNPLVLDSKKVLSDYIGCNYETGPEKYKRSSPLEFVSPDNPPTLIIHGENDVMVAYEHSKRLDEKLTKNNVKHLLVTLSWATHGCDYNFYGPSGQISTFAIEEFLNRVIKK